MAERGTYRHDRRQAAGRVASSIKHAGARAARMFFGASPQQKKKLRKTVDKRGVKLDDLNVNALDRSKFHAPEKIGESVRLIDIAMGNAPDGPAPEVLPPPPPSPTEPVRPTRRPPPPRPTRPGPAPATRSAPVDQDDDDDDDDGHHEHDEGRIGLLPALAGVLALLAFALFPTSGFLLRTRAPDVAVAGAAMRGAELDPWGNAWCSTKATPAKRYSAGPDGRDDGLTRDDVDVDAAASTLAPEVVAAAAYAEEATLTLGLLFTWLAMTLGRLRAPRGGLVAELSRAAIFASLPAVLGAVVVLWSCDAAPSLGLPAPPDAITPVGDLVREQVTPRVAPLDVPAPGATAAGWAAACLLVALLVRRSLGRPSEPG